MSVGTILLTFFVFCLVIITWFILTVLACAFALGHMHTWLKGKAEIFGDNEGLREELMDLRDRLIELNNAPVLHRNNGTNQE